jgi:hypothetical protein
MHSFYLRPSFAFFFPSYFYLVLTFLHLNYELNYIFILSMKKLEFTAVPYAWNVDCIIYEKAEVRLNIHT